ncbi:hypothetical protein [Pseudomonas phage phiNN]|uniref:Uncharacterized protein n=1 Tax=Pseudomonas phage phiNN TaxID=1603039 RepID=A0A0B4N6U0_9VIRU|nr:hypothetical protein [Pseudomonas phage phiNN]AIK68709.1 hypothetical protein [Pseudomonas phage phiNN]
MLLPVVARAAVPAIESAIAATPGLISRIATTIGSKASPSAILAAVKNSPVVAGLTLAQIGTSGYDAYQTLLENHPEVGEMLKDLSFKADPIEPDFIGNLGQYREELELIEDAARYVGGMSNLIRLRQALELDVKFYGLKLQLNDMGYRS